MPRIKRPPESRSKVSAIFASTAGWRYGVARTRDARWIRDVAAAIHESIVQVSLFGELPCRWSFDETKSKPSSSARFAAATGSAPFAAVVGTFNPNLKLAISHSLRSPGHSLNDEPHSKRRKDGRE